MDADIVQSGSHQLTGADVAATVAALNPEDRSRLFAVACTAGTTNLGIIDDMQGIGDVCTTEDIWFHVDGAYGGAALAAHRRGRYSMGSNGRTVLSLTPTNGCSRRLIVAH